MLINWKISIRILGVATCLVGSFLMAFGDPIIVLNHSGIATVIGIIGLGTICGANKLSLNHKRRRY